jgi:hypothetical protein
MRIGFDRHQLVAVFGKRNREGADVRADDKHVTLF